MIEKIADKIAETIEYILSKAQVIDRINNDEIVKRQDYLSIASGVLALSREKIKKSLLTDEEILDAYYFATYPSWDLNVALERVAQAQLDKVLKIMEGK